MKESKCGVGKFTSFIMFVSPTTSLSTFRKSSMLYKFTPQNPVNFTPVAKIHHPAGCWAVSTMSRAGVSGQWVLSLPLMAPTKLPLCGNSHKHTHTHTHTHTNTYMENKTKQRCTTLIEKYWTNLRHYLI